MTPIAELVRKLSSLGTCAEAIAVAVEAVQEVTEILNLRKEKDRARKASARAGIKGGSKENPGMSAEFPQIVRGHSEDSARDISSSLSTFLLVDQPLKEGSKEVKSELVALDARDVSRVISDDWPDDYELQFWEKYPRKIGRKAARTKLRTIRARHEVTFAALMAGVAKIPIGEAKFIPHPTTWLNQGRWEDEHSNEGTENGTAKNSGLAAIDRVFERFNRPEALTGPNENVVLSLPARSVSRS